MGNSNDKNNNNNNDNNDNNNNNIHPNEPPFLGIPKDETEWLKYEGECMIFAGIKNQFDQYDEIDETCNFYCWDFENDDITKMKLIEGLKTVGVKCDSVIIQKRNNSDGTKLCKCICYYNKPYQVYYSEFFIENLSNFYSSNGSNGPLEFYFVKKID